LALFPDVSQQLPLQSILTTTTTTTAKNNNNNNTQTTPPSPQLNRLHLTHAILFLLFFFFFFAALILCILCSAAYVQFPLPFFPSSLPTFRSHLSKTPTSNLLSHASTAFSKASLFKAISNFIGQSTTAQALISLPFPSSSLPSDPFFQSLFYHYKTVIQNHAV